ncbi:putative F-box/FBD/LRR-repeat protein-like [Capsicum annuum]|uniref:FBD domain-containing protein n=1 Tax=Capsicum annuum TaxID=4072 RepID=A0A2G2XXW3_CAPAN|nr:putative F-box/FBD/LRR-repeat protein-like [Capsicum annuum]KAF3649327.1 putative F-box/FBD/LRR-repeat protein-like [Capsicum annuum]PHT62279.1 hypothetical protein T459_33853 [Capsicum annuum]
MCHCCRDVFGIELGLAGYGVEPAIVFVVDGCSFANASTLGSFISSHRQLLEHLALEKYSDNANHMEINAPKLRSFVFIGPGEVPGKLPSALNCLKRLYLSEVCVAEHVEVAWALCLKRSSPYLEELEIKGEIPASFSDATYNYLRAVKIKGVAGAKVEMQLIKVLLAKSPVLRRMVIDPDIEGDESLKELAQITKFQRASP